MVAGLPKAKQEHGTSFSGESPGRDVVVFSNVLDDDFGSKGFGWLWGERVGGR